MRARLREHLAQFHPRGTKQATSLCLAFFAKLKDRALEWAAIAFLAPILSAVFVLEELMASWVATLDPIWIVRAFNVILACYGALGILWLWTVPRPRFDELTGTYLDKNSGQRYCASCYEQKKRFLPMRHEPHGWRCMVCDKYFPDPARPPGPRPPRKGRSWVRDY